MTTHGNNLAQTEYKILVIAVAEKENFKISKMSLKIQIHRKLLEEKQFKEA